MPRPIPQKDKGFTSLLIKELRATKSLRQQDMADILSISRNRISQLENGHSEITVGKFIDWCRELNVEPLEIFQKAYEKK